MLGHRGTVLSLRRTLGQKKKRRAIHGNYLVYNSVGRQGGCFCGCGARRLAQIPLGPAAAGEGLQAGGGSEEEGEEEGWADPSRSRAPGVSALARQERGGTLYTEEEGERRQYVARVSGVAGQRPLSIRAVPWRC